MAAPMRCCLHLIENENGPLCPIYAASFEKIVVRIKEWIDLGGREGELAEGLAQVRSTNCANHDGYIFYSKPTQATCTGTGNTASSPQTENKPTVGLPVYPEFCADCISKNGFAFHRSCYNRFTCPNRVTATNKRIAKQANKHKQSNVGQPENDLDTESRPLRPKRARQEPDNVEPTTEATRRGLFPKQCIICKNNRYATDYAGRRNSERLCLCMTEPAADTLKEAARKKRDHRLLAEIGDFCLIAKEARYHNRCYVSYTKCVTNKPLAREEDVSYSNAFELFCARLVEKRVIEGHEVMRMNELTRLYKDTVFEVNNVVQNSWTYRNQQLKRRLRDKYPELVFVKPPKGRTCEFVMCELDDNAPRVLVQLDDSMTESDTVSNTASDLETDELPPSFSTDDDDNDSNMVRDLYIAAQCVKGALKSAPRFPGPWPPTADDLSDEAAYKMIPPCLYNFLAWCSGESEELKTDGFVKTNPDVSSKLLAISQDIVYFSSKGRKVTPKHYILAMTMRHLTGSSEVIGLLNGLGHSISHTSVLEYDTALAKKEAKSANDVPAGMTKGNPTTLVFDNNDFGEETLSGAGTTHNTNGIMIQTERDQDIGQDAQSQSVKKSRKRTLSPPPRDIVAYHSSKKRKGPPKIDSDIPAVTDDCEQFPRALDTAFIISKLPEVASADLPGWTGFNTIMHQEIKEKSNIAYLPIIDAPATEMSTVNTVLQKSVDYADKLELQNIVVVFDQAIYSKAQQIRWKNSLYRERLILRLGDFHTTMCYLSVLGKRFKDSGLKDILIESGAVAEGSINGVFSGHHYNRSMRCHKLVYEAMQRLCWQAFLDSLGSDERVVFINLGMELHNVCSDPESFKDIVKGQEFQGMADKFAVFVSDRSSESDTFAYWHSYLEMVETLLLFVRATREGDWYLHLSSLKKMIAWFFAYDKFNYARYAPVYLMEMANLLKTHPQAYRQLSDGGFVVQRQENYGFSSIACDQSIEQTVNRDSKTKGGLTGITLSKGAVHRWVLAHSARAQISKRCREIAGKEKASRSRKDLDGARITADERAVTSVITTIQSMTDPFTIDDDGLLNISNGIEAPADIRSDLMKAEEKGHLAYQTFVEERLVGEDKDVFSTIKLAKLKTFSDVLKKGPTNGVQENVALKANTDILGRMVVIGQAKNLDMKDVLSYSLHPFPAAIASHGGALVKTDKAKLRNYLKEKVKQPETESDADIGPTPKEAAWILDGMAVLQQFANRKDAVPKSFADLARSIFDFIVSVAVKYGAKRIDFVTDRYPENSIKGNERERRAASGVQVIRITRPQQSTPKQFKNFLKSGKNKESLTEFLFEQWCCYSPESFKGVVVLIAHGSKCHSLRARDPQFDPGLTVDEIQGLNCDHEEADTRMFLHAKQAAADFNNIVIRSEDTDVFVIAVSVVSHIDADLFFHHGPWSEFTITHINKINAILGETVSRALIGLHAFTGCDSVSAFKSKGKIKPLDLLMADSDYQDVFAKFGQTWGTESLDMPLVERFVCHLYGRKEETSVNLLRYHMFRSSYKVGTTLPPNWDSLSCHCQRANYQAAIFRRCLMANMDAPSPTTFGWMMEKGTLKVVWNTTPIAPDALLKHIACACKKGCGPRCSCRRQGPNGLKCSELCKCEGCTNQPEDENAEDDVQLDRSGDEDEDEGEDGYKDDEI